MRTKWITWSALLILLVGLCAPVGAARAASQTSSHVFVVPAAQAGAMTAARAAFLDKTRFLLHGGAAFFAFHHFVLQRYHDHGFDAGAQGRTSNFVKAGIALLFAYHELHVDYDIANKSSSKTLHALVTPINALLGKFDAEKTKLTNGDYNPSDITDINSAVNNLGTAASKAGYGIKDVTVPVPGAS